jgi:hypothetical protein
LDNFIVQLLLHKIGIDNQQLERFRAIIYGHIASYSPGKEAILALIPALKKIIADTTKERDEWDESAEGGKIQKILMQAVAAYSRQIEIMLANNNDEDKVSHHANESMLMVLNLFCNHLVKNLKKACFKLSDQQLKLKVMQTAKGRKEHSVETKMFKTLKDIGIELSLYHGRSLNGKDIKKIMNNATYFF